jgi:hypothetical protein
MHVLFDFARNRKGNLESRGGWIDMGEEEGWLAGCKGIH